MTEQKTKFVSTIEKFFTESQEIQLEIQGSIQCYAEFTNPIIEEADEGVYFIKPLLGELHVVIWLDEIKDVFINLDKNKKLHIQFINGDYILIEN